jgi:pimeloyl-ACP methyl ester carboxylesterase
MARIVRFVAVLVLAGLPGSLPVAPRAAFAAEGATPPDLAAMKALSAEWFAAADDAGRAAVETRLRAVPPLPADAVEPLRAHLFELAAKSGPRLPKKARAWFYDEKEKKGLYILKPGKKGGGLLISMHGGGEGSGDSGSADSIWASASGAGFTVISPEVMAKVSSAWNEEKEERFVLDLVDAAVRTFECDTDRIMLAGHSMGGDGSWMIGGRNADRIAAIAPLAGSVMPYMASGALNRLETPRGSYQGLMEGVVPNLMHVAAWIHHSDDDRNEAIHPDDIATGYLKKLQGKFPEKYVFNYDRVSGNGHALPKGGVKPIIQWLGKQVRRPHPDEVVWETWWPWKRSMYWLHSEKHGSAWRFHAKITAPNVVDVSATSKPTPGRVEPKEMALTVLLTPELFNLDAPLKITCGGKTLHEGPAPRTLWAMVTSIGGRNDSRQWYQGHVTVTVPRLVWWDLWEAQPK